MVAEATALRRPPNRQMQRGINHEAPRFRVQVPDTFFFVELLGAS